MSWHDHTSWKESTQSHASIFLRVHRPIGHSLNACMQERRLPIVHFHSLLQSSPITNPPLYIFPLSSSFFPFASPASSFAFPLASPATSFAFPWPRLRPRWPCPSSRMRTCLLPPLLSGRRFDRLQFPRPRHPKPFCLQS